MNDFGIEDLFPCGIQGPRSLARRPTTVLCRTCLHMEDGSGSGITSGERVLRWIRPGAVAGWTFRSSVCRACAPLGLVPRASRRAGPRELSDVRGMDPE